MTGVLAPVLVDAPLVTPSPGGLYSVTSWTTAGEDEPLRWLPSGVEVRPHNYGGADAFGVWDADWCASAADLGPGDVKEGVRREGLPPFPALTVWATDECDLSLPSQAEVRTRAAQNLLLQEQIGVERRFSERLLADAGTAVEVADLVAAVARLEGWFAEHNTVGFIHASATWAARAAQANLLVRGGVGPTTPLGHRWVFGGGYVDGLADTLVGTSPTFGWRSTAQVRTASDVGRNAFVAIAERSIVVGYEASVGAVGIG